MSAGPLLARRIEKVVPSASVAELAEKTKVQKGIILQHDVIPGANHFFEGEEQMTALQRSVGNYVDKRMVDILASKKDD